MLSVEYDEPTPVMELGRFRHGAQVDALYSQLAKDQSFDPTGDGLVPLRQIRRRDFRH